MKLSIEDFENIDEARGYFAWLNGYCGAKIDREIESFLGVDSTDPTLKRAREALLLTTRSAAAKMNISAQSLSRLEKNEEQGTITLNSLKMAAEALDCDLVYAIVPKNRKRFSLQIWKRLYSVVRRDSKIKKLKSTVRGNAIAELANILINDSRFRRQQGWSQHGIAGHGSRTIRERINPTIVRELMETETHA